MESFAIYCRASEESADGLSSDPAEQEVFGRAWADQNGVEVDEVVTEVASGALAADDRKLGRLIERCERGELSGIIVRDEKRFARDVVAGGAALARLTDCGTRLIATWTGFDSKNLTPEGQMVFNMLMSVGQAERERNRLRRILGKDKAAEKGVWCSSVPVGYDRDSEGRLVPNGDAESVREIFRRRAAGEGFSDIARDLSEVTVTVTQTRTRERKRLTRSGVRRVVLNRAYLGEQRIPVKERRGEPKVLRENHRPIVTEAEWEAANAVRFDPPIRRGLAAGTSFAGLVRCGPCGRRLHVLAYGKNRDRLTYACTGCGRVSMAVSRLEPAVEDALTEAFRNDQPELIAAAETDERYEAALAAVERASHVLAEYRDSTELQAVLGMKDWTEGLRVRREALDVARRALRELPKPKPVAPVHDMVELIRKASRPFIAEVLVYPKSAEHRAAVRWIGATEATPISLS